METVSEEVPTDIYNSYDDCVVLFEGKKKLSEILDAEEKAWKQNLEEEYPVHDEECWGETVEEKTDNTEAVVDWGAEDYLRSCDEGKAKVPYGWKKNEDAEDWGKEAEEDKTDNTEAVVDWGAEDYLRSCDEGKAGVPYGWKENEEAEDWGKEAEEDYGHWNEDKEEWQEDEEEWQEDEEEWQEDEEERQEDVEFGTTKDDLDDSDWGVGNGLDEVLGEKAAENWFAENEEPQRLLCEQLNEADWQIVHKESDVSSEDSGDTTKEIGRAENKECKGSNEENKWPNNSGDGSSDTTVIIGQAENDERQDGWGEQPNEEWDTEMRALNTLSDEVVAASGSLGYESAECWGEEAEQLCAWREARDGVSPHGDVHDFIQKTLQENCAQLAKAVHSASKPSQGKTASRNPDEELRAKLIKLKTLLSNVQRSRSVVLIAYHDVYHSSNEMPSHLMTFLDSVTKVERRAQHLISIMESHLYRLKKAFLKKMFEEMMTSTFY